MNLKVSGKEATTVFKIPREGLPGCQLPENTSLNIHEEILRDGILYLYGAPGMDYGGRVLLGALGCETRPETNLEGLIGYFSYIHAYEMSLDYHEKHIQNSLPSALHWLAARFKLHIKRGTPFSDRLLEELPETLEPPGDDLKGTLEEIKSYLGFSRIRTILKELS